MTTTEGHDTPDTPPSDPINPAHYKVGGAEVIDIVENLPYNRGAAVKYLVRAGKKASKGTSHERPIRLFRDL